MDAPYQVFEPVGVSGEYVLVRECEELTEALDIAKSIEGSVIEIREGVFSRLVYQEE